MVKQNPLSPSNKIMYYKTYKGKPTKYQQKKFNNHKGLILILGTLIIGTGWLCESIKERRCINYQLDSQNALEVPFQANETILVAEQEEDFALYTNKEEVETKIHSIAKEMGKEDWTEYLVKLAYCESRLDPNAYNDKGNNPADSYDRGIFQYNSYWQSHISDECAYDVECATRNTIKMIEAGKQNRWVCDEYVKGIPIEIVMNK